MNCVEAIQVNGKLYRTADLTADTLAELVREMRPGNVGAVLSKHRVKLI